ncbi:hypothetical protein WJX79_007050 [Trebouxia sp. C0005]|nr:MAG: hypothetical protein FRX49_07199 [Trebouxia sp. A1-2]
MQDADIDKLVLEYCKKRGFAKTGALLREEAGVDSMALSAQRLQVNGNGIIENMLYSLADQDPTKYADSFQKLASWVDNSLDLYKDELARVLYPLFIHCYLELITKRATSEAHRLLTKQKQRFTSSGAQTAQIREQEIQDLQSVAVPEHVATNRTASAARAARYPVTLSTYSLQLLMAFLQGAKLWLLLGIVNQHLKVQEVAAPVEDGASEQTTLLTGPIQGDVVTINQRPLDIRLLKDSVEDKWREQKAAGEEAGEQEVDEQGKLLTKKVRQQLKRAAEKERARQREAQQDRMEPQIPLVGISDELEADMLQCLEQRAALSPTALPSAAFYTFVNSHHTLNCVTTSSDAACVAGGFADSSVRIYDLEKMAAARGQASDEAAAGSSAVSHLWGHSGAIYGLDYSPDQQLLYTSSADGTVRLWSTALAANLVAYRGHSFPVWDVAASPHGHYFASASADKTGRVWCTERASPLRILTGHQSDVDVVQWHPNSHYVATGSSDCSIRLWDIRDASTARVFVGHRSPVTALAFSLDGQTLASGSEDGSLMLWDLKDARRFGVTPQHKGPVWSLAYSKGDGSILASGSADHTVQLWGSKSAESQETSTADGASHLSLMRTFQTKATPVFYVHFTPMNLLIGSGALTLRR